MPDKAALANALTSRTWLSRSPYNVKTISNYTTIIHQTKRKNQELCSNRRPRQALGLYIHIRLEHSETLRDCTDFENKTKRRKEKTKLTNRLKNVISVSI